MSAKKKKTTGLAGFAKKMTAAKKPAAKKPTASPRAMEPKYITASVQRVEKVLGRALIDLEYGQLAEWQREAGAPGDKTAESRLLSLIGSGVFSPSAEARDAEGIYFPRGPRGGKPAGRADRAIPITIKLSRAQYKALKVRGAELGETVQETGLSALTKLFEDEGLKF